MGRITKKKTLTHTNHSIIYSNDPLTGTPATSKLCYNQQLGKDGIPWSKRFLDKNALPLVH